MEVIDRFVPTPSIIERHPLSAADEGVVKPFGVEGRIKINEIDRLVGDILAHDIKAIAEIEPVGSRSRHDPAPT